MICTKCNNEGVLNTAGGKDFYYCRTCKDEIRLEALAETVSDDVPPLPDDDDIFNQLAYYDSMMDDDEAMAAYFDAMSNGADLVIRSNPPEDML